MKLSERDKLIKLLQEKKVECERKIKIKEKQLKKSSKQNELLTEVLELYTNEETKSAEEKKQLKSALKNLIDHLGGVEKEASFDKKDLDKIKDQKQTIKGVLSEL